MRGEHKAQGFFGKQRFRIIPACAGSTLLRFGIPRLGRGSSPHARGARDTSARTSTRMRDHPRMRGEHLSAKSEVLNKKGSSPHARGALAGVCHLLRLRRDHPRMRGEHPPTPRLSSGSPGSSPHARGAPCPRWSGRTSRRDHPRMRGEHAVARPPAEVADGIIPACAGSTRHS